MRYFFLLLIFTTLNAGDRWDYYLRTHSDISWNEKNQIVLTKVCDKISQKFNLITQHSQPSMAPFKSCKWSYSYLSNDKLTPEQAGNLLRKVYLETMAEIHRSPETITYLTEDTDAKTFSSAIIGIKISFFQKDRSRPPLPYAARIYADAGKTFYNLAGSDNQLDFPIALD